MFSREVSITKDEKFDENTECLLLNELFKAIGYLSWWAFPSPGSSGRYSGTVKIFCHKNGDISACYYDKEGNHTYTIGAVLDRDSLTYSFHS